jgi:adenylylsulfate kinase-like enzyme
VTFVVWLTGLPGSGKSTIATELMKIFDEEGIQARYVRLDEIRRMMVPEPRYDEAERDIVYRAYVLMAKFLYECGVNVLMDATAHRRAWRETARGLIKDFFEVYVKCPIEMCLERETSRSQDLVMRKLYLDALERLRTGRRFKGLGEVPGVDVPYEETEKPEVVVESDEIQPPESASKIFSSLWESSAL